MKSKIVKSRRVNDGILELIEFIDDSSKIIKYEISLGCMQKDVIERCGVGEFRKVAEFENKNEALNFFNNQI